jgi:integrase
MTKQQSSKPPKKAVWPRKVRFGRVTVPVYRRPTGSGNFGFMVANYADGKRRFDSYATEAEALEAADTLAKRLSQRDVLAASMTREQAVDYTSATQGLAPFNVSLPAMAATVTECLKLVGDLPNMTAACKFYAARHKLATKKPVAEVVAELLAVKESRGASPRYLEDLRNRLKRVAKSFVKDASSVTTADVQEWLDAQKFSGQGYTNYRSVLHLLFNHAAARGYAVDNPVVGTERVKVRRGETQIFTPTEISRLLAKAPPDFLPVLALGAFAGVRSAEIERMEWSDIDLLGRHVIVGANRAKTAGRRIVPICDALLAWLLPYAGRQGKIWPGTHDAFYDAQKDTAAATQVNADTEKGIKALPPVKWKSNALRHSYASYRFAQTGDAGRVAGELGNSAPVVHAHYRELVKPADAERWFNVKPEAPENVVAMAGTGNA